MHLNIVLKVIQTSEKFTCALLWSFCCVVSVEFLLLSAGDIIKPLRMCSVRLHSLGVSDKQTIALGSAVCCLMVAWACV